MAGLKAMRLEALDKDKSVLARASGFLVSESDGLFLYTCWHVVTGIDFLDPTPLTPPERRAFIKLYCQDVQQPQPGTQVIGDVRIVEVPLFTASGEPRWLQQPEERANPDLQAIGFRVPKSFDVVRIPVNLDSELRSVVEFQKTDIFTNYRLAGTDVVIVGYPYGYSAMGITTPEPVFLKRAIASSRTSDVGYTLLDGGAAPGMSGAPVLTNDQDEWWLLGMYTGVIFPDYQAGRPDSLNDRRASLGLMAHLHLGRAFMQVPGAFD